MPVLASAWLNSLATVCGTPTRFAKAGLCAAAAIRRACFGDLLGMIHLFRLCPTAKIAGSHDVTRRHRLAVKARATEAERVRWIKAVDPAVEIVEDKKWRSKEDHCSFWLDRQWLWNHHIRWLL